MILTKIDRRLNIRNGGEKEKREERKEIEKN